VQKRENTCEGNSTLGGSISVCTGSPLLGPEDKSPHVSNQVETHGDGNLLLCRRTAPVIAWMEAVAWVRNSPLATSRRRQTKP